MKLRQRVDNNKYSGTCTYGDVQSDHGVDYIQATMDSRQVVIAEGDVLCWWNDVLLKDGE